MDIQQVVLMVLAAYFIGSVPIGYLIGRLHGINVFGIGSGNMGAANIARAVSRPWGGFTWFLDSLKGVVAILVVRQIAPHDQAATATMIGAIVVIIGHIWSILIVLITGQARGGKGAATTIGTWFMFIPLPLVALVMLIWTLVLVTTRMISVAVLTAVALISLMVAGLVAIGYLEPVYISYLLVSVLIFYRHQKNIQALLEGRERRVGDFGG